METNRKRSSDGNDDKNKPFKGKRRELTFDYSNTEFSESYEFVEGFRVFDFPWLEKEGVIFDVDEYLEPEDRTLATCSYLESEIIGDTYCIKCLEQCDISVQNQLALPTLFDQNLHGELIEDGSFDQVNDLDPVSDSIWSYVIDQPLDVGLKKLVCMAYKRKNST